MFNVLKKMLKKELGNEKYSVYASTIKQNIKGSKHDNSAIFNEIYAELDKLGSEKLLKMQEGLETSLLSSFQISRGYWGVLLVYFIAFGILGFYVIQKVAVPAMIFLSIAFLVKTLEFLINRFCYVDIHLVLIFKAALEKRLKERNKNGELTGQI